MAKSAQQRAVAIYRRRLAERGITRYEVRGLDADKTLLRQLAARLAANDAAAQGLRADLVRSVGGAPPTHGGVFAALRRSPLVGVDLDLTRDVAVDRDVEL
jgi:hypothetical protein